MFLQLQRLIVPHKKQIELFFLVRELGLLGIWLVGLVALQVGAMTAMEMYGIGRQFGTIALIFYLLSLMPGIMSRSRLLPLAGITLMLFRRHLGIIMFVSAFVHYSFTTLLPMIIDGWPLATDLFRVFGLLAFFLTTPLWLTANDTSERFLGRKWKILHRLTYVVLLLVFGHVALQMKKWAIVIGVVIVAEILSWIVYWRRPRVKQPVETPTLSPTPV